MAPRILFLFWALLLPLHAAALGLGDIRVDSALNEPLDARIELLSLDPREVQDIRVVLADQYAFKKAGLERPYLLTSLRFKVGIDARGNGFIHVTTRASVKEPFLNFLLEVNWRGGVLQREYVVLLDPPRYRLARTPVRPAAPVETETLVSRKRSKPYRVRPAETLWEIAEEVRPKRSHTTEQVMLALQRRNPEAFLDNNVNQLKSGALLEVPDSAEVERMGSTAAKKEFQRQTQAWREKRAQLQQPVPQPIPEQEIGREVPEQQVPAEPEPSAAVQESLEEEQAQLKILEPVDREAVELALSSTEGGAGEQMQRLRTVIEASKQELESVREINRELDQLRTKLETEIGALRQALQERDAVIDELIKRMEREDAAAAALERLEADTDTFIPPPVEEVPGAIDSSLVGSASLIPEKPVETGSSYWATGLLGVVILVMSLVAFFLWWSMNRGRRGKEETVLYNRLEIPEVAIKKESYDGLYRKLGQQELEEKERQKAGQDKQAPEEEVDVLLTDEFLDQVEGESSDEDEAPDIATEAKVDVGAILTEADVYLIYRQYAKAEALVQECLQSHPQKVELMAKLLEIYASQKAKAQFVTYLDEVADTIREADPDVWQRIEDFGSLLVPEHPLFNLGGSALSEEGEFDLGLSQQDKEGASAADIPSFEERLREGGETGAMDAMDWDLDLDDSDKDRGR
jgi:pilus assembly protein FimV